MVGKHGKSARSNSGSKKVSTDAKPKAVDVEKKSAKATGKRKRSANAGEGVAAAAKVKLSKEGVEGKRKVAKQGSKKRSRDTEVRVGEGVDGDSVIDALLRDVREIVQGEDEDGGSDTELKELKAALVQAAEADELEGSENYESSSDEEEEDNAMEEVKEPEKKEEKGSVREKVTTTKKKMKSVGRKDIDNDVQDSSDSDVDFMHGANLKDLRTADPEFYNYLAENDAELLEFQDDEGDSDGGEEAFSAGVDSDGDDDDDGSDEDAAEEAAAMAEAGLGDVMSDEDIDDEKSIAKGRQNGGQHVVDMAYLRSLKEMLKNSRSSLKAVKDLLRLFRAGRELATGAETVSRTTKSKAKLGKRNKKRRDDGNTAEGANGEEGEDEEETDEFVDDGSFTAGNVRFASAKAYQQSMNMAIIGVQDALDRLLRKPTSKSAEKGSAMLLRWDPSEHTRWKNLEPLFKSYVYHMVTLTENMQDAPTLRFLMKRLERMAPYTKSNLSLTRRLMRIAVRVWGSEARHISEATKLRAYLLMSMLAGSPGNAETVLRASCNAYSNKISRVCNPRTIPSIQFAITCLVELFGISMGASYTVAFSYLREMAVSLRAVLTSRDGKEESERVHNWQFMNSIRLWSKVLSRYGSENELRPLIYPFVQVSLGAMRVQPTPRTYPLRLHVASFLSDMVATNGVFVPLAPHLLSMLRCSELRRKPVRGSTRALEWRALLRVNDDVLKTKPYLTGIVNGVLFQLAKYFSCISKHVSFPELAHHTEVTLRKFSKEVQVSEWRRNTADLADKLHQNSALVAKARSKADFGPKGAIGPLGMCEVVPGLDGDLKTPVQRFYEVEAARVRREEAMRDEASNNAINKVHDGNDDGDAESEDDSDIGESDSEGEGTKESESDEDEPERKPSAKGKRGNTGVVAKPLFRPLEGEEEDEVGALDLLNSDEDEGENDEE